MSSSNKVVSLDPAQQSRVLYCGGMGSGKSVLSDALFNSDRLKEEMYKQKLEEDNRLFDHFIATGEVVNDLKEIK